MRYETLRGPSISRLMFEMRQKHGSAAVLIKQREVKEGGLLGTGLLSRKIYEIHYMVPEKSVEQTASKKVRPAEFTKISRQELARKLKPVFEDESLPETAAQITPAIPTPQAISEAKPEIKLERESTPQYFLKIRAQLLGAKLSATYADSIIAHLESNLSKNDRAQPQKVEQKALERLAETIRTVPDIAPPRGEARAVMLIGPTGMGKTTSLAKLAARYFFYEKREVSMYSLDRYRLAATQQLRMYADVMKLPFHAPMGPSEFREQTSLDPAELLLIDTSGIGYRDAKRLAELQELAEACAVRLEKHLVLSANADESTLEAIFAAYDAVGFDKILLTKLDESEFIGTFIEYADKVNRPFSFVTNGQDVPADLIGPGPEDLARILLRKEAATR